MIRNITKHIRVPKLGLIINCPECDESTLVGHLARQSLKCTDCKQDINKYDWLWDDGKRLFVNLEAIEANIGERF